MSPNYGMLDAMIASALKRLPDKHVHFRTRVSVEEQRAQKYDRVLRGRQTAYMIYEHFRATRTLSDLFNIRLQNDDVQDFDVRWDQALLSASDMPSDAIFGRVVQVNIAGLYSASDRLGLVRSRKRSKTSYLRLKTSLKLHIDHVMRARNFSCVERVMGWFFQWKAHGHCSEGDWCSFSHDRLVQGVLYGGQRGKERSSSPAPNSKAKTDGEEEKPSIGSGNREESSSDKRREIPCRYQNCAKSERKVVRKNQLHYCKYNTSWTRNSRTNDDYKWLRQRVYDYKHTSNIDETNVTNNDVNGTTHTDKLTVQHWAHCAPSVDVSSNLFTLFTLAQGLVRVLSFHLIHGHAHWCLSVLVLLSFYFLLDFTFLLFLILAMVPSDSMNNPLCHSAIGSMVSLDYCTPDTIIERVYTIGLCTQDSYPRKSFLHEKGKLGSRRAVKFSQRAPEKFLERKGPSRGKIQKCEPRERNPFAPKFAEGTQDETLQPARCARGVAWDLAKNVYKLKNADKATYYSPIEARVMPAPTSKRPEEREFVVDPGASMHMMSKKEWFRICINWTLREYPGAPLWCLQPMEKCIQTRKHQGFRSRPKSIRDGANTRWHDYSYITWHAKNTDLPLSGASVRSRT